MSLTPSEIRSRLAEIAAPFGREAWADIGITVSGSRESKAPAVEATIYTQGLHHSNSAVRASSATFEGALDELALAIAHQLAAHNAATIRKLALAIIDTTDASPDRICTDAALRVAGFGQHDIDTHGPAACELAATMAGNAPFAIVTAARLSNAAE